jgi:hypothetical protein
MPRSSSRLAAKRGDVASDEKIVDEPKKQPAKRKRQASNANKTKKKPVVAKKVIEACLFV